MQDLIQAMRLEEQIGQILMVGFMGPVCTPELRALIEQRQVGNIILFSRNVQNPRQVLQLTQELQAIAREAGHRYPLLIAIDQENGMVNRLGQGSTLFPGNMALGATHSARLAYEVALATGKELKALGINYNLAPVVDVNNNPANPVIGVRSFGEDPHEVGRMASAMVRGYREANVLTSLKHFPGHGDTATDSHLALPTVPHALDRLETLELIPFREAIQAGADTVMVAHINFPYFMSDPTIPSTVSREIVHGLLREKLGFQGVIITDCLEMQAITKTTGTEQGAIQALQAGNDLILVSHSYPRQKGSFEALKQAIESGQISRAALQEAVQRVLTLKASHLSWGDLPMNGVPELVGGPEHAALSERAYTESTTLYRNNENLIPLHLSPETRLLLITPARELLTQTEDQHAERNYFEEAIKPHHQQLQTIPLPAQPKPEEIQEVLQAANSADLIIMATTNTQRYPKQAECIKALIQTGKPVIGIAVRNPYDLLEFPELKTYLLTYEYTAPAIESAARILFGKTTARGQLPVNLPGM
jgi:beta-N-acetylhexosaminidase